MRVTNDVSTKADLFKARFLWLCRLVGTKSVQGTADYTSNNSGSRIVAASIVIIIVVATASIAFAAVGITWAVTSATSPGVPNTDMAAAEVTAHCLSAHGMTSATPRAAAPVTSAATGRESARAYRYETKNNGSS
jgi:hypothetical protein